MGIQGLLVAVKPVIQTSHVSQFRGKRVAVDGYCWLHKAVYGCCVELAQGRDTNKAWISYCMQYINMLLHHQIHIVMVFDGDALPAKLATEVERRKGRAENLRKAKDYEARGDHSNARNYYARAVDVTPKMAAELIAFLRQHCPQVECIVAPYEADAQLAYLTQIGYVDIIISEDSDNIPYGSKEVMFKLDRDGSCQYLDVNMLFTEDIDKFDLRNFSMEMMITMCILSGCDYLASVQGMGLKTSFKMMQKHRSASSVLKALRISGKIPLIPANIDVELQSIAHLHRQMDTNVKSHSTITNLLQYELDFFKAFATFNHQIVYDPRLKQTVHRIALNKEILPECLQLLYCHPQEEVEPKIVMPFLGVLLDANIATGIACGLLDPSTKEAFSFPSSIPPALNRAVTEPVTGKVNAAKTSANPFQTKKAVLSYHNTTSTATSTSTKSYFASKSTATTSHVNNTDINTNAFASFAAMSSVFHKPPVSIPSTGTSNNISSSSQQDYFSTGQTTSESQDSSLSVDITTLPMSSTTSLKRRSPSDVKLLTMRDHGPFTYDVEDDAHVDTPNDMDTTETNKTEEGGFDQPATQRAKVEQDNFVHTPHSINSYTTSATNTRSTTSTNSSSGSAKSNHIGLARSTSSSKSNGSNGLKRNHANTGTNSSNGRKISAFFGKQGSASTSTSLVDRLTTTYANDGQQSPIAGHTALHSSVSLPKLEQLHFTNTTSSSSVMIAKDGKGKKSISSYFQTKATAAASSSTFSGTTISKTTTEIVLLSDSEDDENAINLYPSPQKEEQLPQDASADMTAPFTTSPSSSQTNSMSQQKFSSFIPRSSQESINRLNQLKQQLAQQHIQEITSNMESDPCDTSREEEVAADKYDPYLESLSPPTKENQSNVFQKITSCDEVQEAGLLQPASHKVEADVKSSSIIGQHNPFAQFSLSTDAGNL